MKVCQNCGCQVEDNVIFCTNCGVEIKGDAAQAPNPAPVPNAAPIPNATTVPNAAPIPNAAQGQQTGPMFNGAQQMPYQQPMVYIDPKDHTKEFDVNDIADNKLFAVSCYFFGLFGVILGLLVNSPYTRFHAKNAIRLEIALILCLLPCIIPILGYIVTAIAALVLTVVKIIAIVSTFQGQAKDLPIIGDIAFLK